MGTHASVGKSSLYGPFEAGREAAARAVAGLSGEAPHFCLVFASSGYDQTELLQGVRSVTGAAKLSGCSGEGVIAGPESDERDRNVGVLAIRSAGLAFETFLIPSYSADPAGAGRELARQVRERGAERAFGLWLFPDGLLGNCSELLGALDAALPPGVVAVGGTAGDAMVFERTFQYRDGDAATDAIAAVLVRGDGSMDVAVSHGCSPIGLERRITRAEGGWLREIDGRSAWSVFKEYLDGDPQDLNAEGIVHLCVGEALPPEQTRDYEPYIIRTPLALDKESGALFFPGGGLREGSAIRLTRRDPAKIRESARACAARIGGNRRAAAPAFVLQFDCAGRGRILFGSCAAEEIVRPLQEAIGPSTPWIGFHTYGEIAPIAGRTHYHNYTVALCAVYDGARPA